MRNKPAWVTALWLCALLSSMGLPAACLAWQRPFIEHIASNVVWQIALVLPLFCSITICQFKLITSTGTVWVEWHRGNGNIWITNPMAAWQWRSFNNHYPRSQVCRAVLMDSRRDGLYRVGLELTSGEVVPVNPGTSRGKERHREFVEGINLMLGVLELAGLDRNPVDGASLSTAALDSSVTVRNAGWWETALLGFATYFVGIAAFSEPQAYSLHSLNIGLIGMFGVLFGLFLGGFGWTWLRVVRDSGQVCFATRGKLTLGRKGTQSVPLASIRCASLERSWRKEFGVVLNLKDGSTVTVAKSTYGLSRHQKFVHRINALLAAFPTLNSN